MTGKRNSKAVCPKVGLLSLPHNIPVRFEGMTLEDREKRCSQEISQIKGNLACSRNVGGEAVQKGPSLVSLGCKGDGRRNVFSD